MIESYFQSSRERRIAAIHAADRNENRLSCVRCRTDRRASAHYPTRACSAAPRNDELHYLCFLTALARVEEDALGTLLRCASNDNRVRQAVDHLQEEPRGIFLSPC